MTRVFELLKNMGPLMQAVLFLSALVTAAFAIRQDVATSKVQIDNLSSGIARIESRLEHMDTRISMIDERVAWVYRSFPRMSIADPMQGPPFDNTKVTKQ